MKTLKTFLILFFITISVKAQQTTAGLGNSYSLVIETSKVKEKKTESLYNLDLENYLRVPKADREFFVPHTRKLKLQLDIKRTFLKASKKTNLVSKLA